MESGDYWVLLKSGWRVFPVRVVNNKIDKGWAEFWTTRNLRPKLRLLFGAERKWYLILSFWMNNTIVLSIAGFRPIINWILNLKLVVRITLMLFYIKFDVLWN